ncbi:MAG: NfeD family protein [Gammaproteobacteria bacterium]|nr:NfeD family protein [Gammaproteobacteria bacterium]NVK86790.1 NfeD family protein [Gammaproteobacteria bacterium]
MFELFSQLEYWHWLSLGCILLVLEMLAPSTLFLWMGVSALVVSALEWLFPSLSWQAQFLIFGGMSLVTFFAWRHWSKSKGWDDVDEEYSTLNQRSAALIGRRAVLIEPLKNGHGRIQLDDTYWRVEGEDCAEGTQVEVTGIKGATLIVAPVAPQSAVN